MLKAGNSLVSLPCEAAIDRERRCVVAERFRVGTLAFGGPGEGGREGKRGFSPGGGGRGGDFGRERGGPLPGSRFGGGWGPCGGLGRFGRAGFGSPPVQRRVGRGSCCLTGLFALQLLLPFRLGALGLRRYGPRR